MTAKKTEKRIFSRSSFVREITLLDEKGGGVMRVKARDLGTSGLAFTSEIPFPRGMRLLIRVPLDSSGGTTVLTLHGEVTRWISRKTPGKAEQVSGIGVEWLHPSVREILALEAFVEDSSPQF